MTKICSSAITSERVLVTKSKGYIDLQQRACTRVLADSKEESKNRFQGINFEKNLAIKLATLMWL